MIDFGKLAGAIPVLLMSLCAPAAGQTVPLDRLPEEVLPVRAPAERIGGSPGTMQILDRSCPVLPAAGLRSRIVNTAVQEWGYFGFTVLDYTVAETGTRRSSSRRRWSLLDPEDALRLAGSIAGYWAAAPDSGWILQRQNNRWKASGLTSRWRDPWSAAFISWVMCESGLGEENRFARAVAHHTYIDQAILARDNGSNAAYVAFDTGREPVLPGDMLCRGSRPAYRSLAERRDHLGVGARTHCDIVVKVDMTGEMFHVIGGNVRGTVGMKLLPAAVNDAGFLVPEPYGRRYLFAHLKLDAPPVPLDALDRSPTMVALDCIRPASGLPGIVFQSVSSESGGTANTC